MKRRLLATFLSLCLLVGLLPTVALAEESPASETQGEASEQQATATDSTLETTTDLLSGNSTDGTMSGTCGATEQDNVRWTLNKNGETVTIDGEPEDAYTLTISGTGAMMDYSNISSTPWGDFRSVITHVDLTEGLTTIGSRAFSATAVTTCRISSTVQEIKNDAFSSSKLAHVEFAAPSKLESIGAGAFWGTSELKMALVLPDSLKTIGNLAFQKSGITSVKFGENLKTIGVNAFCSCPNLTGEVYLPDSLENLGNYAFNTSPITSVRIGPNIKTWGGSVFNRSTTNPEKVHLTDGNGVLTISGGVNENTVVNSQFVGLDFHAVLVNAGNELTFKSGSMSHYGTNIYALVFLKETLPQIDENAFMNTSPTVIYGINNEIISWSSTAGSCLAVTNGGTFLMDTEFEANTLAAPVKHANIFSGWYTSDDFKEGTEVTGSAVPNTTYYAKWTESTYSLSASSLEFDPISYGTASEAKAVSIQGGGSICSVLSSNPKVFTAEIVEGKVLVSPADTLDAGTYRETIFITASDNATFFLPVSITISKASASIGISANPSALSGGGTVTLTVNKSGLPQNAAVSVSGYSGILDTGNGTYTVTLPNATADYTFTVQYQGDINHLPANAKCTVSVTQYTPPVMDNPPSSGSGYLVSLDGATDGGTVTVRPVRADQGELVTITVTPDPGYVLDSLTVQKANGTAVPLTKVSDSVYTFQMPDSRVTVSATFKAAPVHSFTDVKPADYYYDAVLWAAANGVTNGITATTFGPELAVSRAQMVTFLWRASGSPKATGTNPFADVSTSDYYYDAVLWAVANGVTKGTSSTTFSPDAAVTRAQAVTFQWRAAGTPAAAGSSFADVPADAYFANAVAWAVANGITNGTSSTTFSPDAVVTRAQAVAFLYRAAQ